MAPALYLITGHESSGNQRALTGLERPERNEPGAVFVACGQVKQQVLYGMQSQPSELVGGLGAQSMQCGQGPPR